MKNFSTKRFIAYLLFIVMVVAALPAQLFDLSFKINAAEETIYVLAGSDFQASSHNAGATIVSGLLDKIKVDYPTMDGFLFAGDYDVNYSDSANGKAKLQETVQAVYGTGMDEIYVQGNHDGDNLVGSTLTASGANDAENYGVFVINEKDYMWYNDDEATIKKTAENLEAYLNAKRNAGYTQPIFVISHLPLHYSMRARSGGGDGKHANYIFDVLNEAGNAGLNIIFMFGHNHSHGWDDYLGGAVIYLAKGDKINIAQNSTTVFEEETLAFTYMNAGYVGYYGTSYTSDVDKTLTMSVFEITGDTVTVKRYDSQGLHDLKSTGVYNVEYPDSAYYSTNSTVYSSPQTITLNKTITPVGGESGGEGGNTESGTATSIEQVTSLEQGVPYIITSYRNGLVLTGTTTTNKDGYDSLLLSGEPSVSTTDLWYYNGTNLIYGDPDSTSTYLLLSTDTAYLGASHSYRMVDDVYLNDDGTTFSLKRTDDGLYLNQYGGSGYTAASPYDSDGNSDDGSKWVIYKVNLAEKELASFTDNGVTVTTYDITGLNVTVETKTVDGYSAYKSYDINPENYTQGDEATVDIELDMTIFSANRPVMIIDNGTVIKTANIVDGKVSFTTSHFSVYAVAQASVATSGGDWVTITEPTNGTTTYTYTQATSITAGGKYVIVANSNAVALMDNNGSMGSQTVTISGSTMTSTVALTEWTFSGSSSGTVRSNNNRYLRYNSGFSLHANNSTNLTFTDNGSNFRIWNNANWGTDYSLYYSGSSWTRSSSTQYVRLYQLTDTTTTGGTNGLYGKIDGSLAYEVKIGTSKEDALAKVMAGITGYTNTTESDPGTPLDDNDLTWTVDSSYDGSIPGEYAVTIEYKGETLGVAKVTVLTAVIENATISSNKGSVERGSKPNVSTGATITLNYDDGTTATVDVTVGMLKGDFDVTKNGTYSGLDVAYGNYTFKNFTLEVTNVIGNDFPEYPDEGAVKVNKVADATKLQSSGLVNVELSTSGINVTKGADVVVVIDTSSSMSSNDVGDTGKSRIEVLSESLEQMLTQFQTADSHGHIPDIDIAIIDFNGYYSSSAAAYDEITITNSYRTNVDYAKLFTGSNAGEYVKNNTLSANDFVAATSLTAANVAGQFTEGNCKSGTNYDGALENAYKLLAAKQAANGEEERDSYVIFLSDGAPFRYNGYNNGSSSSTYNTWNNYLSGYWTADEFVAQYSNNAYTYFYNGNGSTHPHLYAEAIKGTPGTNYKVVSRDAAGNNPAYVKQVEGLGATIYSIGFGLADDGDSSGRVTVATQQELIEVISSGAGYNYPNVQTADELDEAFNQIVNAITYAARNAYFVDQMGQSFDLMMGNTVDKRIEDGGIQVTTLDGFTTQIQVLNYSIYRAAQVGKVVNGVIVTDAMVGQRYGDPIVVETITFKETIVATDTGKYYKDANGVYWVIEDDNYEGTRYSKVYEVFSDKVGGGNTNILVNGIITAKNFWYNTTANTVKIDTNGDGTADYDLLTESFYWNIGTISDIEWALSYWLYLTGAMEGNAPAGSYKTNESAVLYYINWLGNSVQQGTTSPQTGWESANVSYAFYLVDQNGNPVINQTTGQTGSFYDAVKVTKPVIYQEILLNNLDDVDTIEASSDTILPDGYELYDKEASYKVVILSEDGKGSWTITSGDGKVQSSYVTGYSGTLATNIAKVSSDSNMAAEGYEIESNFDYTHTVIYFALLWIPTAIPDQVVIDYGLPVDISVLGNDQFGENGTLNGLGLVDNIPTKDGEKVNYTGNPSDEFKNSSLALTFGVATIIVPKVRYTPNKDMNMTSYDQFAYEVEYNKYEYKDGVASGDPVKQYYYGTVTVIPATTIYYEETFVDFENGYIVNYDANGKASFPEKNEANRIKPGETYGAWSALGNYVDKTQGEDRPGQFSLDGIDSNNVYGFDSIYNESTTYSLGSAMQVTVNNSAKAEDGSYTTTGYKGYAPTATFTFTGTGFDIISLTDSDAGMILVTVKKGDFVKSTIVANYYGMSYDASTDTWTSVDKADGQDTIWQVPVIKMDSDDLDGYGTYTVEIQLVYMTMFDLDNGGAGNGEYNFILDAIRIYDPAGTGVKDEDATIEDAYKADNEYNPQYFLIRDMLVNELTDNTLTNDNSNAVVFIDGMDEATLSQYKNPGPNNEVYLAYGQSIAFNIAVTYPVTGPTNGLYKGSKPVVNLGAKIAYGGTVTVGINADKSKDITTATDMYHTMPLDWAWTIANGKVTYTASVVLANTTEDTVLSLTNIKITENTDEFIQSLEDEVTTVSAGAAMAASVYNLRSANNTFEFVSLAATAEEPEETIRFYADEELVAFATSVMVARFAPDPEIIVPTVFVPEAMEYTVLPGLFGYNTVRVITSKDVASLTVNGVEAQNLNNSLIMRSMLKLIDGIFGTKLSADDYSVWTVTTKRAASYDIVAYNAEGLSSDPAVAQSTVNSGYDRSEIYAIMAELAKKNFAPERFESYVNERFDGVREVITETSDDVDYVVIDGEIVDRYITEKKVDLETGEETSVRVWVTETDDEEKEEISVNVYDEKGVSSESKQLENKNGKKSESKKDAGNEKNNSSNKNWFGGNKFNSGKGKKERI